MSVNTTIQIELKAQTIPELRQDMAKRKLVAAIVRGNEDLRATRNALINSYKSKSLCHS